MGLRIARLARMATAPTAAPCGRIDAAPLYADLMRDPGPPDAEAQVTRVVDGDRGKRTWDDVPSALREAHARPSAPIRTPCPL